MGSDDEDNLFASDDENVVNYDDEQERDAQQEDDVDALFDDEEDEGQGQATREEPVSDGDKERGGSGAERSDEEEPARPRKVFGPPLDISAPLVALPPSNRTYLMKASNIVDFEPRPFDPDSFQAEQEEFVDEQGVKRVRLRDQNVVRWRWGRDKHGNVQKESNARFVKWSDGSWQLLLGDEVLDVAQLDMTRDLAYLYVLHGGTLQAQAQLVSKLQFRPSSLDSKSHKRLREVVDKRHTKMFKVGHHVAMVDPEKEKAAKEKLAFDAIRTRENIARKQERKEAQYTRPPPSYRSTLTVQALEQDDDDDLMGYGEPTQPASHLRRHYDDEGEGTRKLMAAQHSQHAQHKHRRTISDDEEEREEEEGDYEEDDEGDTRKKSKAPQYGGTQDRDRGREREKPKDKGKPKAKRGVVMSSDEED